MFNLPIKKEPITRFLLDTLQEFETTLPDIKWSCIALYSCPIQGWISLNFDTTKNSSAIVEEFQHNGPDWYHEDAHGRCNNNCPDFKIFDFETLSIPEWEGTYNSIEEDDKINCVTADGVEKTVDLTQEGDEGLNKLVFSFLKQIANENRERIISASKNRESVSRLGVQMLDSKYVYFDIL